MERSSLLLGCPVGRELKIREDILKMKTLVMSACWNKVLLENKELTIAR